jgi:hypothetical protein
LRFNVLNLWQILTFLDFLSFCRELFDLSKVESGLRQGAFLYVNFGFINSVILSLILSLSAFIIAA